MVKYQEKNIEQEILELLGDIKKLIILQLVKGDAPVSSEEIGAALGVTGRTIRNIATTINKKKFHG